MLAALGLPHARGGVSHRQARHTHHLQSSPRPWGCFHGVQVAELLTQVFPTPVGVFLKVRPSQPWLQRLPHARGGVSAACALPARYARSSPRPWGCFFSVSFPAPAARVFPTPVGVFPMSGKRLASVMGLPHARGGVSAAATASSSGFWSSPRPWGCFFRRPADASPRVVFPTPVGVFPIQARASRCSRGLPHARGGVSRLQALHLCGKASSPRPWGCFRIGAAARARSCVFPTPVGVFPMVQPSWEAAPAATRRSRVLIRPSVEQPRRIAAVPRGNAGRGVARGLSDAAARGLSGGGGARCARR